MTNTDGTMKYLVTERFSGRVIHEGDEVCNQFDEPWTFEYVNGLDSQGFTIVVSAGGFCEIYLADAFDLTVEVVS